MRIDSSEPFQSLLPLQVSATGFLSLLLERLTFVVFILELSGVLLFAFEVSLLLDEGSPLLKILVTLDEGIEITVQVVRFYTLPQ